MIEDGEAIVLDASTTALAQQFSIWPGGIMGSLEKRSGNGKATEVPGYASRVAARPGGRA
jgi:hypothetical protein